MGRLKIEEFHLSPLEDRIFKVMKRGRKWVISELVDAVYKGNEPPTARHVIQVLLHRLGEKLEDAGEPYQLMYNEHQRRGREVEWWIEAL